MRIGVQSVRRNQSSSSAIGKVDVIVSVHQTQGLADRVILKATEAEQLGAPLEAARSIHLQNYDCRASRGRQSDELTAAQREMRCPAGAARME